MDKREFIAEVFNERQANLERSLKDPTNAHRAGYEYGLQFSQNLVESLT